MNNIISCGSIFSILTFIHFFSDFLFQSHESAIIKHKNKKVRLTHCWDYIIGFIPILYLLNPNPIIILLSLSILFSSHYMIDSYMPVYLWALYIRKPPEMQEDPSINGFIKFNSTALGKILTIVVDQIFHLLFLIPVIILIVFFK